MKMRILMIGFVALISCVAFGVRADAAKKPAPEADAAPLSPTGEGLTRDAITATFHDNLPSMQRCYLIASQKNKAIQVHISTAFEIASDGHVQTVKVAKTDHQDGLFESCIVDAIRSWVFQPPVGGVSIKVTYPLLFSPGSTVTMANDEPPASPKGKRKRKVQAE